MSDHEYTERIEGPDDVVLSEQDEADLAKLLEEKPEMEYHPVLRVWQEILKQDNLDANMDITMQWANGIVAQYQGIGFGDMPMYRDRYFELVGQMVDILDFEISTDEDCLTYTTPEEDRVENAHHYKNLLRDWQCLFLRTELEWDCTSPRAAVDIAALAEVHKVFFGQQGLTGHLEAIKFEFTEADQEHLAEALTELRENFRKVEGR
jgi:hypothetical protein